MFFPTGPEVIVVKLDIVVNCNFVKVCIVFSRNLKFGINDIPPAFPLC